MHAPNLQDYHVAIDRNLMHVRTAGVAGGLPAVVLESGNGFTLESWNLVAQHLAPRLPVFAYDRAGIGSSEGGGAEPAAVAARLAALLDAARVSRPVILVGHSIGGLYARYYAAARPREVAGLVLVDSTPEELRMPGWMKQLTGIISWAAHGAVRAGLLRLPRQAAADPAQVAQLKAMARAGHIRASLAEVRALPQTQQAVALIGPPRNLPVLCIGAGSRPRFARSSGLVMQRSHERLGAAGLQPWSRYHRIDRASHNGLLTDPAHAQAVAGLILDFAGQLGAPAAQN